MLIEERVALLAFGTFIDENIKILVNDSSIVKHLHCLDDEGWKEHVALCVQEFQRIMQELQKKHQADVAFAEQQAKSQQMRDKEVIC